jgi:uncharacterized OB-fold protein
VTPKDVPDWILPDVTVEDAPFWEAARNHTFRMQRCQACDFVRWPPGPACPHCWSDRSEWTELSGRGTVTTWVVYHRPFYEFVTDFSFWAEAAPYTVAEVELAEGPRYITTLDVEEDADVYAGMPVTVAFTELTDDVTLPVFEADDAERGPDESRRGSDGPNSTDGDRTADT